MVRGTCVVRDHAQLQASYDALVAKHPPLIVKNRLTETTRDVLVVIRYTGVLCEVQFHFESILAIKAYSHFPYNIERASDAIELFEFPRIATNMESVVREQIYALYSLGRHGAIHEAGDESAIQHTVPGN